jgi:hypothetical protein
MLRKGFCNCPTVKLSLCKQNLVLKIAFDEVVSNAVLDDIYFMDFYAAFFKYLNCELIALHQ